MTEGWTPPSNMEVSETKDILPLSSCSRAQETHPTYNGGSYRGEQNKIGEKQKTYQEQGRERGKPTTHKTQSDKVISWGLPNSIPRKSKTTFI